MENLDTIEKRMKELEGLMEDAKGRLPAHSTKPPVMMELLGYEDEYEDLMKQRNTLKSGGWCI